MAHKSKSVKLTVTFTDAPEDTNPTVVFDLANTTDWSIFAEDILEIKKTDGEVLYIPTDRLKGWSIK